MSSKAENSGVNPEEALRKFDDERTARDREKMANKNLSPEFVSKLMGMFEEKYLRKSYKHELPPELLVASIMLSTSGEIMPTEEILKNRMDCIAKFASSLELMTGKLAKNEITPEKYASQLEAITKELESLKENRRTSPEERSAIDKIFTEKVIRAKNLCEVKPNKANLSHAESEKKQKVDLSSKKK